MLVGDAQDGATRFHHSIRGIEVDCARGPDIYHVVGVWIIEGDAGTSDGEVVGVPDQDSVPVGDMAVVLGIVSRVQSPV